MNQYIVSVISFHDNVIHTVLVTAKTWQQALTQTSNLRGIRIKATDTIKSLRDRLYDGDMTFDVKLLSTQVEQPVITVPLCVPVLIEIPEDS